MEMQMQYVQFFTFVSKKQVISDMAPNFEGDKDMDHMGIAILNGLTLKVCFHNLRPGGTLVMKTLTGTLENKFFVIRLTKYI